MKRYSFMFEQACSFESLTKSAYAAARGKRRKPAVGEFLFNLENEVIGIEQELLEKRYHPRPYSTFMVHDPKDRMICAADFRDRVVHHAVCSEIGPIFERSLIFDTYACRTAKGTHRAIKRAQYFTRRYRYFLKLDVRKFFDTIDHKILKCMIRAKIKDEDLLRLVDIFIDHPVPWTEPGRGIPIGNLTSQHFANFYLSGLDHYIKEQLRIEAYIRYMDDSVLFADEKETLWDAKKRIDVYISNELNLKLKEKSVIVAPVSQGLSFLGFRVFPGVIRIQRRGWRRFRRKVQRRNEDLANGTIDVEEWNDSMQSMIGHLRNAATRNLRDAFFKGCGRKYTHVQ
ncbi:MAG: RNA-dependent DNA polymerase [Planctomycetes bacterium]|nr:RNA-dependent DNA polymerase [Planctomycetota bacterium]